MITKIENLYLRRLALVASIPAAALFLAAAALAQFIAAVAVDAVVVAQDTFEDLIEVRIELAEQYAAIWARR